MTRRLGAVLTTLVVALGVALLCSVPAGASVPPFLWQSPEDAASGESAGRMVLPHGIAANPDSGNIYVSDLGNARINEYTVWGEFVKGWGWGVVDGSDELQVCTASTGCRQGIEGSGSGQLSLPLGLAVDGAGDVYVVDLENRRVQKFSSTGEFELMFGGDVNRTKVEAGAPAAQRNVCPIGPADVCQAGISGGGPGQFAGWVVGDYIDMSLSDTVLVGDGSRIQEFGVDGSFIGAIPSPLAIEERGVKALAVDPIEGDIYVALEQSFGIDPELPGFFKIDNATGAVLDEIPVGDPEAEPFPIRGFAEDLATDSEGKVYAVARQNQVGRQAWSEVLKFDSSGACLPDLCPGDGFAEPQDDTTIIALATGSGCNVPSDTIFTGHFGAAGHYVRAYGPPPDPLVCQPPPVPPEITAQYAVSVDTEGATVRAAINPRFWSDARFYVEYGIAPCNQGGCKVHPSPPGALLGGKPVQEALTTSGVFLANLEPDTAYHYRFVAQSSGGGPVFGPGKPAEATFEAGPEAIFKTYPEPPGPGAVPCPNDQFRTGSGAFLPDCRAYEMVSPVDKEDGDIIVKGNINAFPARFTQGTGSGSKLSYSSYRAFGDVESAPWSLQYVASRIPGSGWSNQAISPPREPPSFFGGNALDVQYKLFSPDLCDGWLFQDTEPTLDPMAPPGFANFYRRDICGSDPIEALNTTAPPVTSPLSFRPELQGLSAGGTHAVFRANGKLTADASSAVVSGSGVFQLYETTGTTRPRLVSVLPGGSACDQGASAGTLVGFPTHRTHSVWHAISDDGSRIFWSCGGQLYVRIDGDETQPVSAGTAQFWGATADGTVAYFTAAGTLRRWQAGGSTPIAGGVTGMLGASDDRSRLYLVSTQVLATNDGAAVDPDTDLPQKAVAGAQNVYLLEDSVFSFVARLAPDDVSPQNPLAAVSLNPSKRATRVSADGRFAALMSTASLTGYDSTDAQSGRADAEVFLFDAEGNGGAGALVCVSCNSTGVRPSGRDFKGDGNFVLGVAAKLPIWQSQLYAERPLAEDGSYLFFESFEALVLRDTNGKKDVYEWRRAESGSDCKGSGAELFVEDAGGCISLISSGKSPEDSEFLEATPSGSDVFFATDSNLVSQDYGLVDIYDARVGGGLPSPAAPRPECQGEACQSPPGPPQDPTPASATFFGERTGKPGHPGRRCPKGKRLVRKGGKKGRCVKRKRMGAKR